jgi:hypothetical protein
MSVYPGAFGFGLIHMPDDAERRLVPGSTGVRVDRRPVRRRGKRL